MVGMEVLVHVREGGHHRVRALDGDGGVGLDDAIGGRELEQRLGLLLLLAHLGIVGPMSSWCAMRILKS